ncbi:NAD(P)/FAD-dependent oxidoreductase [Gramella sp. BOM4]|nr:NAD(P)/FAD-dependent oxidoreductase [Christiangramia bathymodioli]
MSKKYDAIIVGSGSNGLAAAAFLQQKGLKTAVFEQASIPGGATKTEEITLPGFKHDIGSAIHPLTYSSPFFKTLPLDKHGLTWIFPDIPFSHPFKDGSAYACFKDFKQTAAQLGIDEAAYIKLYGNFLEGWSSFEEDLLGPLSWPENPKKLLQFGMKAFPPAKWLVNHYFKDEKSRLLFYGAAAHSTLPMTSFASASFGLVLNILAHRHGWPFPKGGASKIISSLVSYYKSEGGELKLNQEVKNLDKLPTAKAYIFDLTPSQLLKIRNTDFSALYRKRLQNYNYGAGVFKIDWALDRPIPFTNELCRKSGTVHLGFSQEEIERSESDIHSNKINKHPYVLVAQHSIFDSTRAPENKHTAWAYCHVPNGSTADMTQVIENQLERAAPGFKDTILAKTTHNTVQLENFNPNLVGGDINGGKQDISQLFTRPVAKLNPYSTSNPNIFICSASTPPGGGVHGMSGYHAAKSAYEHIMK